MSLIVTFILHLAFKGQTPNSLERWTFYALEMGLIWSTRMVKVIGKNKLA